jgi:thiamine-monophosphate kinase
VAEFALIDRLAERVPTDGPGVVLSIGDDAAVLGDLGDELLVAATDTMNAGVHFLDDVSPVALGHKSLAVNLSDLAAMGARPRWALLNLSLPHADPNWLDAFADGFGALAREHEVSLVGGDTCEGAMSIGVTVLGTVPPGQALRRDGAAIGDDIYVSGNLGDAALALRERLAGRLVAEQDARALDFPEPELALGRGLRSQASACIDLSDGLLSDLGHVARQSGLAARVELERLPTSPSLAAIAEDDRFTLQLTGGEDYGLCFCAAPEREKAIRSLAAAEGTRVTRIGQIEAGAGIRCLHPDGSEWLPAASGWEHFREPRP